MRSSRAPVVPEASGAFGLRHVDPRHGLAPGPVHLRILAVLVRLHNLSHRLDPRALVLRHAGRTHQVSRRGRSRVCDSLSRRKAEHNSQSSADREAIANPFAFCKARRDATTVEVPTTFADSSSVSASGTIAKFCRSTCFLRAEPASSGLSSHQLRCSSRHPTPRFLRSSPQRSRWRRHSRQPAIAR